VKNLGNIITKTEEKNLALFSQECQFHPFLAETAEFCCSDYKITISKSSIQVPKQLMIKGLAPVPEVSIQKSSCSLIKDVWTDCADPPILGMYTVIS
jgi:hypothetical protein